MLILSTQLFSFPQNEKNMKEKEGNILLHIPCFLEGKTCQISKKKKIIFFWVAFPLGLF
jgi:hypothetical protein